jgi:hypothetical protein
MLCRPLPTGGTSEGLQIFVMAGLHRDLKDALILLCLE